MMDRIVVTLMILLLGCSDGFRPPPERPSGIPLQIRPYVSLFEDQNQISVTTTFTMSDLGPEGNVFATCFLYPNYIVVNEYYWDYVLEKERLIFHELGHCMLGLSDSFDNENSMMYPYFQWDYERYYDDNQSQ